MIPSLFNLTFETRQALIICFNKIIPQHIFYIHALLFQSSIGLIVTLVLVLLVVAIAALLIVVVVLRLREFHRTSRMRPGARAESLDLRAAVLEPHPDLRGGELGLGAQQGEVVDVVLEVGVDVVEIVAEDLDLVEGELGAGAAALFLVRIRRSPAGDGRGRRVRRDSLVSLCKEGFVRERERPVSL